MDLLDRSLAIGIGYGAGPNRAQEAAASAIANPLIRDVLPSAGEMCFSVVGGEDMTLGEVSEVAELIAMSASREADIVFGAHVDPRHQGEIRVRVTVPLDEAADEVGWPSEGPST